MCITLINLSYIFFSFFIEKDPFIREDKDSYENNKSNEDFYYQYKPEEIAHFPMENDLENLEITSQPGIFQDKPKEMSLMFSCDTCDSAFSMKNDLEGHKATSHSGDFQYKPQEMSHLFTCDTCQSTFPLENDLESHKSTSHDTVSHNLQKMCMHLKKVAPFVWNAKINVFLNTKFLFLTFFDIFKIGKK